MSRGAKRGRGRLWSLALSLFVGAASPAMAQSAGTAVVSAQSLHQIARGALASARPAIARDAALALLQRDPDDLSALLILSRAERDLGQYEAARAAARRAWALAEPPGPDRYEAALLRAQAEASDGRRTIAQYWLRRAVQVAPDEQARQRAIQDFRYVRARNPLGLRFDFGISPSSNINGGSFSDTLWLHGIPFTLSGAAQALSGIELRGSVNLERTVLETPERLMKVGTSLGGRGYRMSAEARAQAPDLENGDFGFWALEAYLSERRRAAQGGEWDWRITGGHNEYGGAALSDYLRAQGGRSWQLDAGRQLRLGLSAERQWRRDDSRNSATVAGVDFGFQQRFAPGDLTLGFALGQVQSDSVQVDHQSARIQAEYRLAEPVAGLGLGFFGGLEHKDYARSPYSGDGRQDTEVRLGLSATVEAVDYMGFVPEVGVDLVHNQSNISLYDRNELGMSLRLRSTF